MLSVIVDPNTMQKYKIDSIQGKELLNSYLENAQKYIYKKKKRGGKNCQVSRVSPNPPCFPDMSTQQYKDPCPVLPLDGNKHDLYRPVLNQAVQLNQNGGKKKRTRTRRFKKNIKNNNTKRYRKKNRNKSIKKDRN